MNDRKTGSFSKAALIMGITSMALPAGFFLAGFFANYDMQSILGAGLLPVNLAGLILGVLAIVFGAKARKECQAGSRERGQAMAGFVLGIVTVVIFAILIVLTAILLNVLAGAVVTGLEALSHMG